MNEMRPKNWGTFQHYKNRRPPWIRLHRSLLDKPDFHALRSEDAKYLVMIWLIASEEVDGTLPPMAELAFRLRLPLKKMEQLASRLDAWLDRDASKVLARRKQLATPEAEAEAERETEGERADALAPEPVVDFSDEEANIPDDLPPAPMGNFILDCLLIPHSHALATKFANAAEFIGKAENCGRGEGARRVIERARDVPPGTKWTFWLQDGGWKQREEFRLEEA